MSLGLHGKCLYLLSHPTSLIPIRKFTKGVSAKTLKSVFFIIISFSSPDDLANRIYYLCLTTGDSESLSDLPKIIHSV